MTVIPRTNLAMMIAALIGLLATVGCDETPDTRDERLAEFAQESMQVQAQQNEHIARQSEAVVKESHQLAEAATKMVESDSQARREIIVAQKESNAQLHQQRTVVDAQRDQLEAERRQIAQQRHRDPLIAAAIQNVGLIIACLLPLIVCIFVIRQMRSQQPDDGAVAELLVREFTSDQPRLLPGPPVRPTALQLQAADPNDPASASGDTGDGNPPF